MSTELQLQPDGRLTRTYWDYDRAARSGEYLTEDVTDNAMQWLYEGLSLAEGVTLRSVFLLLQHCPQLLMVYRRNFSIELLAEALGPAPDEAQEGGIDSNDVEYLAVYRNIGRHSGEKTLTGVNWVNFHGVGYVATADVLEHGHVVCKAGNRINYGMSLTPVRRQLDLPLRLDTELTIGEEDTSVERFWEQRQTLQCDEFMLGEVLNAILWELSFHGASDSRNAFADELRRRVESIHDGTAKLIPLDEVLAKLKDKTA